MLTMDAAPVNTSCPAAFSGQSGAMFQFAVTSLLAAHCASTDHLQWPPDRADDVWRHHEGTSFDYIVIGAGTAGAHLTGKLVQQFPSHTVLLIEAGDDPDVDTEIPGLIFMNQNTDHYWHYKTHANENNCLGYENNQCLWSKGKAMGGSSSINAMLYTRGDPHEYDEWAKAGNHGWDYESLKPFYDNVEHILQVKDIKVQEKHELHDILTRSYNEIGINTSRNHNIEAVTGVGITKILVKDGKRYNSAKVSLDIIKNKSNLGVMKKTLTQKIIIDPISKIATGVTIRQRDGNVMNITARKEIIISAGSIGTPQLLMLSGVGPKHHLSDLGISTIMDLPVGKNLQDHLTFGVFLKIDEKYSKTITNKLFTLYLLQYMLLRSGPLSTLCIVDFMAFVNIIDQFRPDVQFHHSYFTKNDSFVLKPYYKGIGLKEEILDLIIDLNKKNDLIKIYPTLLHPKSRGEILLKDANPSSLPIIKPNYLKDNDDMEVMHRSIAFIEKLINTTLLKSKNVELSPLEIKDCMVYSLRSRAYWECYIRHLGTTIYHPVGTAKMGPITDKDAVVDEHLQVHGIKKLRVVDASIMPRITGGNTMAPTLVIAEKAAEIIRIQHNINNERDEL